MVDVLYSQKVSRLPANGVETRRLLTTGQIRLYRRILFVLAGLTLRVCHLQKVTVGQGQALA